MSPVVENASMEAERDELEAVVKALGGSSRPATLLRFLGEKYFGGDGDQLSEYTIATEVFGRSKTKFDPSQDAIARVEVHRLRKKLKEFYEGPGKDQSIQIAIAHGSYLPVFSRAPEPAASPFTNSSPEELLPLDGDSEAASPAESGIRSEHKHLWLYIAAAIAAVVLVTILLRMHRAGSVPAAPAPATRRASIDTNTGAYAPATVPLRLLAGYTGDPEIDSAGAIWGPDRYVRGGGPWRRTDGVISRTSDPLIFQNWRSGDFEYDIPLRPGNYELHLYFVGSGNSADDFSTFNLRINGVVVLSGFDVNEDAMGENVADERVFRDVSPATDGYLHVAFASERGAPQLSALELLQGIPGKQLPIRIVTQRSSFTDNQGRFWHADNYFLNGHSSDHAIQTTGAPDPNLFHQERYGHFSYAIPVDTRDRYTVILHFAEFYFGAQRPGGGGVGSRLFKVMCNGQTLLDNFDIYKEVGSLHVLTKTFRHVKPSAQGKINLTFEPIVNNATVSGIEVIDEGK